MSAYSESSAEYTSSPSSTSYDMSSFGECHPAKLSKASILRTNSGSALKSFNHHTTGRRVEYKATEWCAIRKRRDWDYTAKVEIHKVPNRVSPTSHLAALRQPDQKAHHLHGGLFSPALHNASDTYVRLMEKQYDESNRILTDLQAIWRTGRLTKEQIVVKLNWHTFQKVHLQCWIGLLHKEATRAKASKGPKSVDQSPFLSCADEMLLQRLVRIVGELKKARGHRLFHDTESSGTIRRNEREKAVKRFLARGGQMPKLEPARTKRSFEAMEADDHDKSTASGSKAQEKLSRDLLKATESRRSCEQSVRRLPEDIAKQQSDLQQIISSSEVMEQSIQDFERTVLSKSDPGEHESEVAELKAELANLLADKESRTRRLEIKIATLDYLKHKIEKLRTTEADLEERIRDLVKSERNEVNGDAMDVDAASGCEETGRGRKSEVDGGRVKRTRLPSGRPKRSPEKDDRSKVRKGEGSCR